MKTRVITSVVGIALLALVLAFFDTFFFNLVFLAITLIAVYEIWNAFQFGKKGWFIYLGFIPIITIIMLSDYAGIRRFVQPMAYFSVVFIALCIILNCNTVDFAKVSGMAVFSAIAVFCFYSLIHLKHLMPRAEYDYDAVYFILLILGYAWGGDTFAYLVGRKFGKRKLAPVVSPHKTVEGAIGGILGSMLVGMLITFIYVEGFNQLSTFDSVRNSYYLVVAVFGALGAVLGIIGDLFASAVKRQCGIKDYGSIFPGHGGILDRFDSVMFVAPLVVMAVRVAFYYFVR